MYVYKIHAISRSLQQHSVNTGKAEASKNTDIVTNCIGLKDQCLMCELVCVCVCEWFVTVSPSSVPVPLA